MLNTEQAAVVVAEQEESRTSTERGGLQGLAADSLLLAVDWGTKGLVCGQLQKGSPMPVRPEGQIPRPQR